MGIHQQAFKMVEMVILLLALATFQRAHGRLETTVVESFHVKSDVRYRFATTQIESIIRNNDSRSQEIVFHVSLPKEAFIVSFSMEIDGKVYNGEVKEKAEAKKEYLEAVARGDSAGHVRQVPRQANIFETSANVVNNSAAKFSLTYQEMLQRKFGGYNHEIHVNPGQPVKDFFIEVFIQEKNPLRFVRTPALQTDLLLTNKPRAENELTAITKPTSETAYITYRPSLGDQGESGISARFVVEYDVEHSANGDIMLVDGYFVHFFAPDFPPLPKNIIFILDVSGSMHGTKIQQLKDAMLEILDDLGKDDRFNIITFSEKVQKWKPELVTATLDMVAKAKGFIRSVNADGGTDINSALLAGVSELQAYQDKRRAGIIFFLTDGEPTMGETVPANIIANVGKKNENIVAIFGLAFGSDADYNLLTTISSQNSGFARKIYEASDAALQVASLYNEISSVSVKDLSIEYLPSSVDEYSVTNNKFPVVFNGSEVIVCGRIAEDANVFHMKIAGIEQSGTVDLVVEDNITNLILESDRNQNTFFTVPRDFSGIVEKMWAFQTVKQYLKETEIHASNETKVKELKEKILEISLKYKFVTPLTSMVVTKPESSDKPVEAKLGDSEEFSRNADTVGHHPVYRGPVAHVQPQLPAMYDPQRHHPRRPAWHEDSLGITSHGYNLHEYDSGPIPPYFGFYIPPNRMHGGRSSMPARTKAHAPKKSIKINNRNTATITPTQIMTSPRVSTHSYPSNPGFQVSAVIVKAKNLSVCLALKNLKSGTYNLIRSPLGAALNIETNLIDRKSKNPLVTKVLLLANGKTAVLSIDDQGQWNLPDPEGFNITTNFKNQVVISAMDLEVEVDWTMKGKTKQYFLTVNLNSVKGYTGLLGAALNSSKKQASKRGKTKLPPACRDKAATMSQFLNSKMAAKYTI